MSPTGMTALLGAPPSLLSTTHLCPHCEGWTTLLPQLGWDSNRDRQISNHRSPGQIPHSGRQRELFGHWEMFKQICLQKKSPVCLYMADRNVMEGFPSNTKVFITLKQCYTPVSYPWHFHLKPFCKQNLKCKEVISYHLSILPTHPP